MAPLRIFATLAIGLCLAWAAPVDDVPVATPRAEPQNYRLPERIFPSRYNITLRPYLLESDSADKRFTFDGEVHIVIEPKETTNNITMHTKNLKYSVREMWPLNNPQQKVTLPNAEVNNVTDIISYIVTTPLQANQQYILHFVYTGTMDDDMHGFYRSSYTDSKNRTKWLGSTQFQTNHARRAFPSFDEPKFKASYQMNITRHRSMKSVSNTRIIQSTLAGEYYTDLYQPTPKMSTYILAFIVSEFNERFNGNFGVLARPEYYDQTEYSFDVGQEILEKLEDYLGIKYYEMQVDKMHMAAIPDFSAGAMENWGLLTYRERALLYEEGSTTLSSKQYIAAVVAHEQAHMWFGDLVTCDWWSYTWLNEGFARYFQYFGTAMVEKDMQFESQFVVDQIQSVMSMDSTNGTNPLSDENTNTPADLSRMFNSISYNKGATFIRMVKHAMGEENFKASLREYLDTHRYQNTKPDQLFAVWLKHWSDASTKQYAEPLFKGFTQQVGYPVITVNVSTDRKSFDVSQKRFLLKSGDGADNSLLYTVPITYTTDTEKNFESTTPKKYLTASTGKETISVGTAFKWVILNIQETGYYRVNYDEHTWHEIHAALNSDKWGNIHELNRAQLVDDLFNFARSGLITYTLALDVLEYLQTETDYLPWTAAFNGYSYLAIRLGTDTQHFGSYIRQLTEKSYQHLGFEEKSSDSTLDIYNRAKILAWSCKYGNHECITKAKEYFNKMESTPVPVNIRSLVYCTAMREGNAANFDTLFNKYKRETVATEETLILNSLGCVKDESLVSKFFDIVISDDVRRQDKSAALTSLYTENNENVTPVFRLVTKKCDELATAMGGYSSVASVISSIASRFTEESQKKELEEFNAANKAKFGSSAATLEAAEKTVAENLAWSKTNLGVFRTYLEQRGSGAASTSTFTVLTLVLMAAIAQFLR